MRKKIVFLNGKIETLNHFSFELYVCFKRIGYDVFFYTIGSNCQKDLLLFIEKGNTVLLTFNFVGLSGEKDFFRKNHPSLWEEKRVRVIQFLVDHPLYYTKQLAREISNMHIYCIDKNHMLFLKKYYKNQEVSFLPLAGNEIEIEVKVQSQRIREKQYIEETPLSFERRNYNLVFVGNCAILPTFYEKIKPLEKEYQNFYLKLYEKGIEQPQISIETLLEEALQKEIIGLTAKECLEGMEALLFLDLYRRDFFRKKVITTLGRAGIKLHLVGKDWESLGMDSLKNVSHTFGMVTSSTCIQILREAKMSLNIMPGFTNGSHDRIFTSMLAGACVITDESKYLNTICKHKRELLYYEISNLDQLPDLIEKYQSNHKQTFEIAKNGHDFAKQCYTWQKTVKRIEEFF